MKYKEVKRNFAKALFFFLIAFILTNALLWKQISFGIAELLQIETGKITNIQEIACEGDDSATRTYNKEHCDYLAEIKTSTSKTTVKTAIKSRNKNFAIGDEIHITKSGYIFESFLTPSAYNLRLSIGYILTLIVVNLLSVKKPYKRNRSR